MTVLGQFTLPTITIRHQEQVALTETAERYMCRHVYKHNVSVYLLLLFREM